jgi:hypothetical protein
LAQNIYNNINNKNRKLAQNVYYNNKNNNNHHNNNNNDDDDDGIYKQLILPIWTFIIWMICKNNDLFST